MCSHYAYLLTLQEKCVLASVLTSWLPHSQKARTTSALNGSTVMMKFIRHLTYHSQSRLNTLGAQGPPG